MPTSHTKTHADIFTPKEEGRKGGFELQMHFEHLLVSGVKENKQGMEVKRSTKERNVGN